MKIKKLFKGLPCEIKGSKEEEVTGIAIHSKEVYPGNLFIAGKGAHYQGGDFIEEAVMGGASAILTDLYNPSLKSVVQIICKDPRSLEKELALRLYENPSEHLAMIGITGTNGKTTTSFYIHSLLEQLQGSSGLIGTLEYVVGNKRRDASKTTPESSILQKLLYEMKEQGCKACVMEVSSHGLEQERVFGIEYDIAVFTNLTQDHLDFHGTMENYAAAKKRLFLGLAKESKKDKTKKAAVLNKDSPYFSYFKEASEGVLIYSYGFSKEATLYVEEVQRTFQKTTATFVYKGERLTATLPLIGDFNLYNAMASLLALIAYGYPFHQVVPLLENLPEVPGRLEKVENALSLPIFVDFSHTEDSLYNAILALKNLNPKKIVVVFGCGGDRDKSKRAKMAQVVEALNAYPIVTSDNPRTENPESIVQEIIEGFSAEYPYEVIIDRKEAIARGILLLQKDEILLVAGRGPEKYQIIGNRMIPFLDKEVIQNLAQPAFF